LSGGNQSGTTELHSKPPILLNIGRSFTTSR
jgi:hypothetical protein